MEYWERRRKLVKRNEGAWLGTRKKIIFLGPGCNGHENLKSLTSLGIVTCVVVWADESAEQIKNLNKRKGKRLLFHIDDTLLGYNTIIILQRTRDMTQLNPSKSSLLGD